VALEAPTSSSTAAGVPTARRWRARSARRGDRIAGLLFVAPLVAMLAIFAVLPLVRVISYSFTRYDGLTPAEWVGLDNYRFLVEWHDFWRIVLNNLLLVCGIVVWVAVPFVLAVAFFGHRRASLVRTVLFVPALLPPIVIGGVFRLLLADQGPLNEALRAVGLGALAKPWLADESIVLLSVIGVIAWAVTGTGVMLYSAGLAQISPSYVEAAVLDGARWRQLVWHIYRPALRPVTRFWMLLLTVGTVTSFFPWIYGLTQGGPGIASTTLDFQVYVSGVQDGRLGLGSALAVVGILLIAMLLAVQIAAARVRRAGAWT
jgi:ABC-type sugar transport system permease subunit